MAFEVDKCRARIIAENAFSRGKLSTSSNVPVLRTAVDSFNQSPSSAGATRLLTVPRVLARLLRYVRKTTWRSMFFWYLEEN